MNQSKLLQPVTVAILGAVGFIMQFFDFPLPIFPSFLKIDFSEIPALVAALIFGPFAGVWVEGIKNVIHYVVTGSEVGFPVGELANFIAGSILVYTAAVIYRKYLTLQGLIYGIGLGTLLMAAVMSVANYFVLFPLYDYLANGAYSSFLDKFVYSVYMIGPFNMIKGAMVLILMIPLYQKLKSFINSKSSQIKAL